MTFRKKAIIVLITGICAAMLGGCITYDKVMEALKEAYDHNVANGKIPR